MATNVTNNQPQMVTDSNTIRNKVCIESPQTETKCDQVKITIADDDFACKSLTSSGSIVIIEDNNQ
jgi:hypothetical protein